MKIALAQLDYHIGNFDANTAVICDTIEKLKQESVDLVVFAELSVCGYPPRDFLEFNDFVRLCRASVERIAGRCQGIAAIVGSPWPNERDKGKPLYNSACFLTDGKVQSVHHKSLLPTYDVFDEYRYFEPAESVSVVTYKGERLAITICEDIWDNTMEEVNSELYLRRKLYRNWPLDTLQKQNPTAIINIAASPFTYRHAHERRNVMRGNAQKYGLPVFYVNHVGAQTELIFDGGSMAVNAQGEIVTELGWFREKVQILDTVDLNANPPADLSEKVELINDALVLGIRDYFLKLGFEKAILGLSGGIDSAVVLALAVSALGKNNVVAVMMPSQYSSDHSVRDALDMSERLGCEHHVIPINTAFNTFTDALSKPFAGTPFGIAEENIQARSRAVILMAMANKFGYVLLNTSNKSEAAVGYGTLYGDMSGGLSPIGDLYKTEVYTLAEHINHNGEIIPAAIITKEPSAELRPNQKDRDSLPAYDILDQILYQYIELRKSPEEIKALGYEPALVAKILRLVNTNEYKRHQTPPVLRVSPKAFGMGRRMPIVAKYLS